MLVSRSVLEGGQLGLQGLHFSVEGFDFGSQFLLLEHINSSIWLIFSSSS